MTQTTETTDNSSAAKPTTVPVLLVPGHKIDVQLVVGCGLDRAIGERGTMPWYVPDDLSHFKELTIRSCVIMGRKTLESIGKALPHRRNIVVSSDFTLKDRFANIEVVSSLPLAIERAKTARPWAEVRCEERCRVHYYHTVSIIGGAQLFAEALSYANTLQVTQLWARFPHADTFFPEVERKNWRWECMPQQCAGRDTFFFCAAPQPEGFAQEIPPLDEAIVQDPRTGEVLDREHLPQGLCYRFSTFRRKKEMRPVEEAGQESGANASVSVATADIAEAGTSSAEAPAEVPAEA